MRYKPYLECTLWVVSPLRGKGSTPTGLLAVLLLPMDHSKPPKGIPEDGQQTLRRPVSGEISLSSTELGRQL